METLLRVPLRRSRDLLVARHKARQIAQMLHFSAHDAAAIAASTFLIAHAAAQNATRSALCFAITRDQLLIFAQRGNSRTGPIPKGALSRALPRHENQLSASDISFVLAQVDRLAPQKALDELVGLNRELLALLAALRDCQTHIDTQRHPSAA
jgi:hypothetical protein